MRNPIEHRIKYFIISHKSHHQPYLEQKQFVRRKIKLKEISRKIYNWIWKTVSKNVLLGCQGANTRLPVVNQDPPPPLTICEHIWAYLVAASRWSKINFIVWKTESWSEAVSLQGTDWQIYKQWTMAQNF